MINTHADLTGIERWAGSISGMLDVIDNPDFEGDFLEYTMKSLRGRFNEDTLARRTAGSLRHVFEWNSNRPLYKVNLAGGGSGRYMTFTFLPSTEQVPLPGDKFGISQDVLSKLNRHVFKLKAVVMETQSAVNIVPKNDEGKLFIPTTSSTKGYIMYAGSTTINPGGEESTGGFASWWALWFEAHAPGHVTNISRRTEQMIGRTGQRVVRHAAGTTIGGRAMGGKFARPGTTMRAAYVDAERRAETLMRRESKKFFASSMGDDE